MKQKLNVSILDISSHGSDRGTSQTEYRIKVRRGTSSPFEIVFLDAGNNAEYESELQVTNSSMQYLISFNAEFETALHEYLDANAHELKAGDFLVYDSEKFVFERPPLRFFAYCPVTDDLDRVRERVQGFLDFGIVALASGDRVSQVKFKGPRANSYGHDLYLYQVDADGNETLLDVGDFN